MNSNLFSCIEFADLLYTTPVNESMDKLPSPEELKMKIIVKARKSSSEDAAKNEDDDEDGLDENIQSTEDLTLKDPLQLNLC